MVGALEIDWQKAFLFEMVDLFVPRHTSLATGIHERFMMSDWNNEVNLLTGMQLPAYWKVTIMHIVLTWNRPVVVHDCWNRIGVFTKH